jgi:crotonobetainyl-CoA:carnitine CoA-transferase CaiB-like acyl-CoA transferase
MMLADLGARVLKIEPVEDGEGDSTRGLAPHLGAGVSSYFAGVNRNKEGLTLNLKHPQGVALLRQLCAQADVIIDNFRPDTMARFGVNYEELRQSVNPRLVSCSISGFGSTGEYRLRSSFDLIVQAMGGAMSVTGVPGGPPVRLGLPMGDIAAGMYASTGILAALQARQLTGRGRHVEISMLDCMAALLSYMGANYLNTGQVPGPQGSGHVVNVPYQAFETKTQWMVIAIFGERYWKETCEVLGMAHLAADPRYASADQRSKHREELLTIIKAILKTRPAAEWLEELLAQRVPCAPINTVDQTLNDPVVLGRHMVVQTEHPAYGRARSPGNPMKVEGIRDGQASAAPVQGEHTVAVLRELLGASDQHIDELKKAGVI